MANEQIQEGFEVFVSGAGKPFGAVRQVLPHGRTELVVYVENAGDFTVALSAVKAVHSQKVIADCDKLDHGLRKAIGHAHDTEDPKI
jgi:acyl CoA:acetate/3-ketoacid CoA transferase alpha subunit